jgi:CheY-like chemotaxis protein
MGKHAQRGAAQVLVAQISEPIAATRRRRPKAILDEEPEVLGLDEIARAYEIWSHAQEQDEELPPPPDFASLINSHAAASPRPEPQVDMVVVSIVGDARTEELVGRGNTARGLRFRCSRTENVRRARDSIVTMRPELIVVDVDVPHAKELVVRLLGDPRTERIPLLVVGTFALQEEIDDYVALGAARAFDKPVPVAVFRGACVDAIDEASGRALEDDEDEDERHRARRAPSIASPSLPAPKPNPQALVPVQAHPGAGLVRSSLQPLAGRRVLVADADPNTVLLIGNAFRSAGCIVEETSHGENALRAAIGRTVTPDLVIVEAPEDCGPVDGVALCEAMRKDVAARDVPVLLLCDADEPDVDITSSTADAVLSKAVSLKTLMGKAGELVKTRAVLEERLRTLPQTSGKLRDLSVRTLLASTGETHARATVRLEDEAYVHTIVLEHGRVMHATRVSRSSRSGRVESGRRAMASALAMRRGMYTVTPCDAPEDEEPADLFADTLEAMRGAAKSLTRSRRGGRPRERESGDEDEAIEPAERIAPPAPAAAAKTVADAVVEELYSRGLVIEKADTSRTDPAPAVIAEPPAPPPPPPVPPARARIIHPEAMFVGAAAPSIAAPPEPAPVPEDSTDVEGLTYAEDRAPVAVAAPVALPVAVAVPEPVPPPADVAPPAYPSPTFAPVAPAAPIAADTLYSARTKRTQILRAAAVAMIAISLGAAGRWRMRSAHPTASASTTAAAAVALPVAAGVAGAADKTNPALPPEGTAEISTAPDTAIVIDGVERGHGPHLSVTLPIGVHALRTGIDARSRSVQITRGRVTHVDLTGGVVPTAAAPVPPATP